MFYVNGNMDSRLSITQQMNEDRWNDLAEPKVFALGQKLEHNGNTKKRLVLGSLSRQVVGLHAQGRR